MPNIKYKVYHDETFEDSYISFAGMEQCKPLHSFGPAVRPCYIIHYILSGRGKYIYNDQEYHLTKNQAFIILPDTMTYYEADYTEPWQYIWIGFHGKKIKTIFEKMNITNYNLVLHSDNDARLTELHDKILNSPISGIKNELYRTSLLLEFLSILIPQNFFPDIAPKTKLTENIYLMKAIEFIQNNFYNNIHVTDIADNVGISRTHLFNIFKKNMGHSPLEYMTYFKLTKAYTMLEDQTFSIESIAFSCGYESLSVFSKAFKKRFGVSPSEYRKLRVTEPGLTLAYWSRLKNDI